MLNYDEEDEGFHFDPTDQELIQSYLMKKLNGEEECGDDFIVTKDVYAKEPWLLEHTNDPFFMKDEWYYFVKRDQMSEKKTGKNTKRKITGDNDGIDRGYWHASATNNILEEGTEKIIGRKRTLTFIPKSDSKNKKQKIGDGSSVAVPGSERIWKMFEFLLPNEEKFQKTVLCKIYIKNGKEKDHDEASTSESSSSSAQNLINTDHDEASTSTYHHDEREIQRIENPCYYAAEIENNNEQIGEGNRIHQIDAHSDSVIERVPERLDWTFNGQIRRM